MPYGQQIDPQQYAAALNAFDTLQKREMHQQAMNRSGNPFAMLGASLGGALAGAFGKNKGQNLTNVSQQIEQYQQQQAAMAEQAKQAKEMEKQKVQSQKRYEALLPQFGEQGAQAIVYGGANPSDVKKQLTELERNMANPVTAKYLRNQDQSQHLNALALQDDRQAHELAKVTSQREYDQANQKPDFKQGDSLRKEFQGLKPVKEFDDVTASMQKIVNSSKDPNPATDIALITSFMKIIDPGSTVREGEFATAQNAGSIDQTIRSTYNSMLNGQRLTAEQREYFVNSAGRLYTAHADQYSKLKDQYGALAQRQGLDPESVFIKRDRMNMEQKKQPQSEYEDGQVIRNPSTGETMIMRNGQWVKQ